MKRHGRGGPKKQLFFGVMLPVFALWFCVGCRSAPLAPGVSPEIAAGISQFGRAADVPTPAAQPSTVAADSPKPTEPPGVDSARFFVLDGPAAKNPRVVVYKAERTLELFDGDELIARMRIALGRNPDGPKEQEGDGKTPEGTYYACARNPNSAYYLSVGVSYPNAQDAQRGLDTGLIDRATFREIERAIEEKKCPSWSTALGGEIMLHGRGSQSDWTAGCIALDDEDMDVIWKHVKMGAKIVIEP